MRKMSCILGAVLLSGLVAQGAAASVITVKVTGHVVGWSDTRGVLGGQITLGQSITGSYTYDTNTPAQMNVGAAQYVPSSPPASVTVSTGGLTFQSVSTSQFQIYVHQGGAAPNDPGIMTIQSLNNKQLAPGLSVSYIQFSFMDPSAQWPTSLALPSGAPTLQNFSGSQFTVSGDYFNVQAQVDSATLSPQTLEVSPASGSFAAGQQFDIALLLPVGTQIASMQATVSGYPGVGTVSGFPVAPLYSFPGPYCMIGQQNSAGRPVILCPNASSYLAVQLGSGVSQVNWQVTLTNGTVLYQNVVWDLVQ